MIRAYDEIVEFIAAGPSVASVAGFEASPRTKEYVAQLLERERAGGLSPEDSADLAYYLQLEHIMRLAKARARQHSSP